MQFFAICFLYIKVVVCFIFGTFQKLLAAPQLNLRESVDLLFYVPVNASFMKRSASTNLSVTWICETVD